MKNWIIVTLLLCFSAPAFSQDEEKTLEYLRQEEQRKRSETLRQLDSGVYYMDIGEHKLADEKFRFVMTNLRSLPSDLTFYFGKNSYFLEEYKQSIDWINKYIQLKGTTGQHYSEATDILARAQKNMMKERTVETRKTAELFSENYDIDCGPTGKISCPVCKGDHVIIKRSAFGDEYRTCPYCDDHGMLSCVEYNQLLRGELSKKQ